MFLIVLLFVCLINTNAQPSYSCPKSSVCSYDTGGLCVYLNPSSAIKCTNQGYCNYMQKTDGSVCWDDLQNNTINGTCRYGSCYDVLFSRYNCVLPKNTMNQTNTLNVNMTYRSCKTQNIWYNFKLTSTINSCDSYQTITIPTNTPTKIGEGFDQDPIIVNIRSNGANIEVCYSYYELRSSNSGCVYNCYYGAINANNVDPGRLGSSQFNYYYSDCDNVDACTTTTKVMSVNYAYGNIIDNNSPNNNNNSNSNSNNTYNGVNSNSVNCFLLLLMFLSGLLLMF
jgi:hypothetical protein